MEYCFRHSGGCSSETAGDFQRDLKTHLPNSILGDTFKVHQTGPASPILSHSMSCHSRDWKVNVGGGLFRDSGDKIPSWYG